MRIVAELNRRNIFRVALLYIVAAWLVLQVFDLLFGILGVPDWVFRFTSALLLICFPLVLAFSWVFEITAQGLKREQVIAAQASITARTGRKITRISLILLLVAIPLAGVNYLMSDPTQSDAPSNHKSTEQDIGAADAASKAIRKTIDLQGHRGARGLMPENTIPAFLLALDLGVTTLEMDVAINAEGHVVVSHEPWMSAKICSHANGRHVTQNEEKSLRIYAMSDTELATFDCGSRGHPDHPDQKTMPVSKPLLDDLFKAVARHVEETGHDAKFGQVLFNIEIKSLPAGDKIFHPEVMEFASTLYQLINEHQLLERTSIQSFDIRALEAVHQIDPEVATVFLVGNRMGLTDNLALLSFTPTIYSPDYALLDQAQIDAAHALNIQVIPWTVNDEQAMRDLLALGVDGLITDYPDLGVRVLAEIQQAQ
ncbi:MAG: glycerophosphodiester phosphodiesterase [Xanthomonadales bacterium]|nr:glycerophosphodiester phosphodiesterase [Xanthomonadales bacterium]